MDLRRKTLAAQGVYYTVTGIVPFLSRDAFEAVTGPKREWWLVQTVAALVTAVGGGLISAGVRDRVTPELLAIATGCAAGLAGIDFVYVARRRISPVYLGDAAVQLAALAGLAARGSRLAAAWTAPTSRSAAMRKMGEKHRTSVGAAGGRLGCANERRARGNLG
jgi:hypothetical protein